MSYVTQGTVQVELKTGELKITISPAQSYSVTHEKDTKKQDYIVFIDDQFNEAKLFEKTRTFSSKQPAFEQYLIDAALKQAKIEVKIKNPGRQSPGSQKPVKIEIESIKIPATV